MQGKKSFLVQVATKPSTSCTLTTHLVVQSTHDPAFGKMPATDLVRGGNAVAELITSNGCESVLGAL